MAGVFFGADFSVAYAKGFMDVLLELLKGGFAKLVLVLVEILVVRFLKHFSGCSACSVLVEIGC